MCGGAGGFMSVHTAPAMLPGTPNEIRFDVELNTQVCMIIRK